MKRVMRKLQQMVSSDLQLAHAPVLQHGVFRLKRCALIGAATLRARLMAPSRSPQTLFMPTMKSTWRGPCAMALTRPGREPLVVEGRAEGEIIPECRGENGFGYDPVFLYAGGEKTFAEMSESEKNAVSHRGNALRAFAAELKNYLEKH